MKNRKKAFKVSAQAPALMGEEAFWTQILWLFVLCVLVVRKKSPKAPKASKKDQIQNQWGYRDPHGGGLQALG